MNKTTYKYLKAAISALGKMKTDLDYLDCLTQIVSSANKLTKERIVAMAISISEG